MLTIKASAYQRIANGPKLISTGSNFGYGRSENGMLESARWEAAAAVMRYGCVGVKGAPNLPRTVANRRIYGRREAHTDVCRRCAAPSRYQCRDRLRRNVRLGPRRTIITPITVGV